MKKLIFSSPDLKDHVSYWNQSVFVVSPSVIFIVGVILITILYFDQFIWKCQANWSPTNISHFIFISVKNISVMGNSCFWLPESISSETICPNAFELPLQRFLIQYGSGKKQGCHDCSWLAETFKNLLIWNYGSKWFITNVWCTSTTKVPHSLILMQRKTWQWLAFLVSKTTSLIVWNQIAHDLPGEGFCLGGVSFYRCIASTSIKTLIVINYY